MTIAVALKVGDGIVLGADSAATLAGKDGIKNVYFNAEKIFNLVKGLPLGMAAYGLGGMASRSLTALSKDLREQCTNPLGSSYLDPTRYTVEEAANRVKQFFYDDLYVKEFAEAAEKPSMGMLITGFSANSPHAEIFILEIDEKGNCEGPKLVCGKDECRLFWRGNPEPINRLINGWSFAAMDRLVGAGLTQDEAAKLLTEPAGILEPAMPIQDAIDLVGYLVDVTIGYVRFTPGPPTVAPPVDIAAITRHEKFRWVRRKHYYDGALNPNT